ncbi:hypothetical protein SSX86_024914 [Deinandra increscens subsp. villosa]|uniref:Uncharacterized protein n=1 Tax=Deinandra increscens subsp. villosa TaxID=3103831 RepID=A0AAP0CBK5_9ASTR
MSTFFSLAGGSFPLSKPNHYPDQDQEDSSTIITPNSLYLLKNEEIYSKAIELWQQYYYYHQPCEKHVMMRQASCSTGGGINCQDCGNQAKKECRHMRCRTCCRSGGYQCQTHVKSTWVPAAKRRERQRQLVPLTHEEEERSEQLSLRVRGGGGGTDQNPRRLFREDRHFIATADGGGAVVVNLPFTHHQSICAEVSSPAVFRCVRVSAIAEAEEQLAYQTTVSIGGHVFKGILYDHGPMGGGGGDSSSALGDSVSIPHQQLNLATSGTMEVATTTVNPNPVVSSVDPSSIFPTPLNAFMAGTQFFPPPRS